MRNFGTIIFGTNDYAALAAYYLSTDSNYIIKAFVVSDESFIKERTFMGVRVVTWDEMIDRYHPSINNLFAPIRDNKFRKSIFEKGTDAGYKFISYVSSKAVINGTYGANCFIQELNNIQPMANVGDNCILWAGNHIGHHSLIEDHCTITSHCVISGHCRIGSGSFLGVNSTIRDGIEITPWTIIGQGANVTKRIQVPGTYIGNPANIIR